MKNYIYKVLYILKNQEKKIFFIFLSFAFVSCIEAISIGLVAPFVSIATDYQNIYRSNILNFLYARSNLDDERLFVALLGLITTVSFCVKSFVVWRVKVRVYSFSSKQQVILRERLMSAYLNAPYTFHLGKNSAHIINNILSETFKFTYRVLNPLLESISNLFIIVFIASLLAMKSWITVISLLVIFLPLVILFDRFKLSITRWGKESSEANQEIVRVINHGLGGVKETQVLGCGSYFKEQLVEEAKRFSKAQKFYYAFNVTPRIVTETVLVVFIVGFTSIYLLLSQDIGELAALLSLFAIASMRLIPAASQLANGMSSLKNSSFTVDKLYFDLKELEEAETIEKQGYISSMKANVADPKSVMPFKLHIKLENIKYNYPQSIDLSLKDLSLTIAKGSSIALIGKSGAGKTTLVDVILGLLIPQSGDIQVDGRSVYGNLRAWQNLIGYIPQSIFLIEDTIERNIAFGIPDHAIDSQKLWQAIETAQLTEFVNRLPQGIHAVVGERGTLLSGGQRQRIGIARALYHQREILVLDEATSALDSETELLVTESIKALSKTKTTITIAHRLTTVQHCDRIYLMEDGKIVKSGSYEEVVLGENNLRKC